MTTTCLAQFMLLSSWFVWHWRSDFCSIGLWPNLPCHRSRRRSRCVRPGMRSAPARAGCLWIRAVCGLQGVGGALVGCVSLPCCRARRLVGSGLALIGWEDLLLPPWPKLDCRTDAGTLCQAGCRGSQLNLVALSWDVWLSGFLAVYSVSGRLDVSSAPPSGRFVCAGPTGFLGPTVQVPHHLWNLHSRTYCCVSTLCQQPSRRGLQQPAMDDDTRRWSGNSGGRAGVGRGETGPELAGRTDSGMRGMACGSQQPREQ
jgi:hypothetical protein